MLEKIEVDHQPKSSFIKDARAKKLKKNRKGNAKTSASKLVERPKSDTRPLISPEDLLRAIRLSNGLQFPSLLPKDPVREAEGTQLVSLPPTPLPPLPPSTKSPYIPPEVVPSKNDVLAGERSSIVHLGDKNPVSILLDYCNRKKWRPAFNLVETGPTHNKRFIWKVCIVFRRTL